MTNRNIVDVFTEYEDGQLIYSCTFNGKHKLAKYVGMKLWLKENGASYGMIQMLLAAGTFRSWTSLSPKHQVIISLMKSHVSHTKKFFQVLNLFLLFRGGLKVLKEQNEVQIKTSTQEELWSERAKFKAKHYVKKTNK